MRVAGRERVVARAAHAMRVARAVRDARPRGAARLEHEHRGRGGVAVDRAVAAVGVPAHEHVERAGRAVVTEHGVVVVDRVGELAVAGDLRQR
jgi:hypothetical protein